MWQQFRTTLSQMKAILNEIPAPGPSAASTSLVLPTMQAIGNVFDRLDQVAPPAVSADMAALTSYWDQVVADLQQHGTTVAQVEAYLKAHPPTNAATIQASTQQLSDYLTTTCHITMSS